LREHAGEQDLNTTELAASSALPKDTVCALLRGEDVPEAEVEERVCARVETLAKAYVARPGKRLPDLIVEVAKHLECSPEWARKLLKGEKTPSVKSLHGLVEFFGVEGGEAFFTAPPADALNRVLLPKLAKYEDPSSDPVQALMKKYGVVGADLRMHGRRAMTPAELEALLAGVIKSVMPSEGDSR
jgi:hypothetical protein